MIKNPKVKGKDLESMFNISRRQLGYRIQKLNDWFKEHDYPEIERTSQGYFIVDDTIKDFLNVPIESTYQENEQVYTAYQRAHLILLMLFSEKEGLSLNHFSIDLEVSKNTILNDIKKLKELLQPYEVNLKYSRTNGYYLAGSEFEIRRLLMRLIDKVFTMHIAQSDIVKSLSIIDEKIELINKQITKIEQYLDRKFIDQSTQTLPYKLYLILRRIKHDKIVSSFSIGYDDLSDTKEYQATEILTSNYPNIPRQEKLFITLQLLSTSVQWSDVSDVQHIPELKKALIDMIVQFEKITFIKFKDRDSLINQLMLHMEPAFYRIRYQLSDVEGLENSLKEDYKELFHLVKLSSKPLEKFFGQSLPENEIAYLTILIGGSLRRQDEEIEQKVKAVVVCTQGTSISQLMLQELRSVFPEFIFLDALSLRDFNQYELDFDIVFSPMHIMTPKKLYITKTILTAQEKHELRQHVFGQLNNTMETEIQVEKMISAIREHATIHNESELFKIVKAQFEDTYAYSSVKASTLSINSTLNLQDLLSTNHINFVERVADIEEAIQLTANPLVRMKYVDPLYIDKMHAAFDDTYMVINQNIAIPHADGDQVVHRTAMSMLILKEPLELSTGLKVHIFVAIAATDKFKHLRPLLQLRDMSQDDEAIQQIVQTDSKIDVYKIIQHFSKID
ncbi:BglG family transcription antiterminator [Mammaliicoccus sciuri]|uniref:BglG family transcription antiterminator n=2 Tax=Mammaliicoccus sciuri TaxID=1296 RepID=UPI00194F955B|nr:BglG family transcription antiterminator [Mammaliicoccus sciuri]MEB5650219.1 BglG family transcription antiterminator [Mammaliicoccus sciuri]MEB6214440.1 BglG family transcription antiterminator [Mammaliicoccus sciuri]MEB6329490.1 BglG family transcription antiterminator [Mammaliicoccus sciuri]MEB7401040.1 BglG family transcription antiterminator [Mammaliicoccus sciuri]MEB7409083.1 BglG family transcription antiterminator [Mammaliicoccus sciuri]